MRFDQPECLDERGPDPFDVLTMEPSTNPGDPAPRRDWSEPLDTIIHNKQSWIAVACLVFAFSPLVLWTIWSFVPTAPELLTGTTVAPLAATPSAGRAVEPPVATTSTTLLPVGPTARFGTETTRSAPSAPAALDLAAADGPCHSAYSGCVPIVSDIDCAPSGDASGATPAGPQGDGPYFLDRPVLVTGDDVYLLDTNGDQIACFDGDS